MGPRRAAGLPGRAPGVWAECGASVLVCPRSPAPRVAAVESGASVPPWCSRALGRGSLVKAQCGAIAWASACPRAGTPPLCRESDTSGLRCMGNRRLGLLLTCPPLPAHRFQPPDSEAAAGRPSPHALPCWPSPERACGLHHRGPGDCFWGVSVGGVAVRAEAPGVPFGRELIGRRMPAAQCTRSCLGRGHRRGARCLLGRAAFLFPATCSPPPWEIWPSSQMAPGPRSWKSRRIPEVPESGRRRRPSQLGAPRRRCGCVVPALAPSPGRARGRGWPSGRCGHAHARERGRGPCASPTLALFCFVSLGTLHHHV